MKIDEAGTQSFANCRLGDDNGHRKKIAKSLFLLFGLLGGVVCQGRTGQEQPDQRCKKLEEGLQNGCPTVVQSVSIARIPITQIELSPGLLAGLKTTCASGNNEKFFAIWNL